MLGGLNAKFFVPDAGTTRNGRGDYVIPARDFLSQKHSVRTVFGMGRSVRGRQRSPWLVSLH